MQRLFSILWRLTILVLPWQTRWIFIDGTIGRFPWEQGTVSFYASWVPLLATIVVVAIMSLKRKSFGVKAEVLSHESPSFAKPSEGGRVTSEELTSPPSPSIPHPLADRTTRTLLRAALILVLIASIFTANLQATLVWWVYAIAIGGFVWALREMHVSRGSVAAWIVMATIPHAILGIQQFFTQALPGNTWFGIAEHDPTKSGTSVVEHGLYRVLRAYGGLPHPNILGGWIAVSLSLLPGLIQSARTKLATYGWLASGFILIAVLVYTFSRGAWIASALAFALASVIAFFASREPGDRQAVVLLVVVCAVVTGFGMWSQWDHVASRVQASEHLETWSLLSRTESFVQGWRAFLHRPIAGWGLGAGDIGIMEVREGTAWAVIAPEPPHAAPAVFALETGILGILALIALCGISIWRLAFANKHPNQVSSAITQTTPSFFSRLSTLDSRLPVIVALVVIALTDHYLVTLWAGMALLGLSVTVCLAPEEDSNREGAH